MVFQLSSCTDLLGSVPLHIEDIILMYRKFFDIPLMYVLTIGVTVAPANLLPISMIKPTPNCVRVIKKTPNHHCDLGTRPVNVVKSWNRLRVSILGELELTIKRL